MRRSGDTVTTLFPSGSSAAAADRFCADAVSRLSGIRAGILVFLQEHEGFAELHASRKELEHLSNDARLACFDGIAVLLKEAAAVLTVIINGQNTAADPSAHLALDILAEVEAGLLRGLLTESASEFDVEDFLEDSFGQLVALGEAESDAESEAEFEIDEETMDVFRSEASELLENIAGNLDTLNAQPKDREALWNIRRCAHTFKGAAGVIGLREASELAHRVEDLLDRLPEFHHEVSGSVIDLLTVSTELMDAMTIGCGPKKDHKTLASVYADFDRVIADLNDNVNSAAREPLSSEIVAETAQRDEADGAETAKPPPAPIARVALDRLDELLNLTHELEIDRSALLAALEAQMPAQNKEELTLLLERQSATVSQIQEKLLQIRMVRFGVLATRLNRAVHVTCQEENKNADLVIENEDCEIDTQILDSLVEPLLHLLRNAVVHGIEFADRRRLIGKPERGKIRIQVSCDTNKIVVAVKDDGCGIAAAKLREKAVSNGLMTAAASDLLNDDEALDLIFARGLTTADRLSINAGRGIGMSIVRESVGSLGGSILISSEPQRGTTFTIEIPHVSRSASFTPRLGKNDSVETGRQRQILVVDDSSSVRQLLKRMVENVGWTCATATDGQNALEMLRDYHPDVVLTDLEMPIVNGYELLETLKNDEELRQIPVVMLTSRQGEAHRQKAFASGAADFLTKPFDENTLITTLDRQIRPNRK